MPNRHPNPNSSAAKSRWVDEALSPIREERERQSKAEGRTVRDLPATIPKRASDVARLTAIRSYQRSILPDVMAMLERLKDQPQEDWDYPFMVADSEVFDWRKAPIKRYAGFEDFYKQELEAVWGKWADLESDWSDLVEGKISEEEFELRRQGKRGVKKPDGVRSFSLGDVGGNSTAYLRARLKRDGQTELLAQVERGEISAHAAAKEAGYRKQAVCHLPTVPGFLKAAQAHLSPEQRLELKEAL